MKTARKILFVLIAMVAAGAGRVSADGTSVIREDRIWEYVRMYEDYWEFLQLRFQGSEMIGDHMYSLLQREKYFRVYKGDNSAETVFYIDLIPDGEKKTVELREEDNALYRLLDSSDGKYELKIYDFDLVLNDEIELPICYAYMDGAGDTLFEYFGSMIGEYPYMYRFRVINTGTERINGEECKFLEMECIDGDYSDGFPDHIYKIVEGVGPVLYGASSYLGTLAMLESWNPLCNLRMYTSFSLNRVYALNGDVIYRGMDIDWQECLDKAGIPALQSGASQAEYYSLQGIRLEVPRPGEVVIKVEGGKSRKISF